MHPIWTLFMIAKIWRQPKYPSIDAQILNMWYIPHANNANEKTDS